MEFFKTISDFLQDGQQLQMAIRKSGESIAVSILPDNRGVKDKAVENITPLVMSGTPEDFEEGFKDALKPLAQAQGLVSNIKEFEESTEKAKRESEMAKKLKDEAAKQKKEFNDLIALSRKNNEEHKFKDARAVLAKASSLPSAEKAIIDKVSREIDAKSGVGNMFGGEEDLSDGKNITPVAKPAAPAPAPKKEEDATAAAFAEAAELDDNDVNENEEEE